MSAGGYSWARPSGVTARLTWRSGGWLQSEPQTAWSDPPAICPTSHLPYSPRRSLGSETPGSPTTHVDAGPGLGGPPHVAVGGGSIQQGNTCASLETEVSNTRLRLAGRCQRGARRWIGIHQARRAPMTADLIIMHGMHMEGGEEGRAGGRVASHPTPAVGPAASEPTD